MADRTSKKEIYKAIASKTNTDVFVVMSVITAYLEAVSQELAEGRTINLMSIGTLIPVEQAAKVFHNPKTGGKIEKPDRTRIKFKPSITMKQKLNPEEK